MMKMYYLPTAALLLLPDAAHAQEKLPDNTAIPSLMFFTLGAVLLVAIALLVSFMRKRSNREAMDKVLNPKNPSNR